MADEFPDMTATLTELGGFTVAFFNKIHQDNGPVVRLSLMGQKYFAFSEPNAVRDIHNKCPVRPPALFALLRYLGKENVLFQTDPAHIKQLRLRYGRMLQETSMKELMHNTTCERFGKLVGEWVGTTQHIHATLTPVIYDIMGRVMFGEDWSGTDVGDTVREKHLYLIAESNRWAYVDPLPVGDPDYDRYAKTVEDVRAICWDVLQKKMQQDTSGKLDVFKLVAREKNEDGRPFFDKEMAISTVFGFMNGAYDTTHSTLCWALFHLAKFPEVQERLREEILSASKSWGEEGCTFEQARQLTYLDAFMVESQRHKASTPFNLRFSNDDVVIDGTAVEKGVMCIASYFRTFQNKSTFGDDAEEPMAFRPERFIDEAGRAHVARNGVLTPFGGGRRMCLGFLLGQIELRAALIAVLTRARLSLAEDISLPCETHLESGVLQPKGKVLVKFDAL